MIEEFYRKIIKPRIYNFQFGVKIKFLNFSTMKSQLFRLYIKKLRDFDDFYLTLLLYLIINTLISVNKGDNTILIISFTSIVIIILLKWLLERYKNDLFKIGQETILFLLNCFIVIIQRKFFNGKENTIDSFEMITMIYGECLIFSVLSFRIIQSFSLIFYLIINVIYLSLQPIQIAYLILMKMAIFFLFKKRFVKKDRKQRKITIMKEKFNFKYNHERTFILNEKKEFNLIHGDYKKGINEDYLSRLQNLDIFILGEFSNIPSEFEFKNCLVQSKKPEKSINLQNLIEKINERKEKTLNIFFIAEGRFFSETEHDIIIAYKMKDDKLILKIRKDILYDQLSKIRQTNSNYSRAISFVAHEFRTPLNCIVSMLQTLDQQIDPKLSSSFIVPAIISSKFLLNLVSDLLDIAQIEAEKFKLVHIDFDLKFLMQDTLQIVVFQAMKRGLELKINFDNAIKRFKSDPNRIRQILINLLGKLYIFNRSTLILNLNILLGNAIKYTTKGSITLSAKRISSHQTQISVEDTGLGIDTANLENLFKAFGKVTNPADSALNAQGVGLGLLISNKLALVLNEMDEGIKVESELNKGSKFYFKIFDFSPQEQITLSSHRIGFINMKECKLLATCGKSKKKTEISHCLANIQKSSENISDIPSLIDTDTMTSSCFFLSDFHNLKKARNTRICSNPSQTKQQHFSINESQKDNVNEDYSNSTPNSFHTLKEFESPISNHRKDGVKSSKDESIEHHDASRNKNKSESSHHPEISSNTFKNQKLPSENNLSYNGSDSVNNNKSKFFLFQTNQQNNSSNYIESNSKIVFNPSSVQIKFDTPAQGESNGKPKISSIKTSPFESSDKKSQIDFQIENIRNRMRAKTCNCPTVLVVDDNDFNILALTSHLERLGINCCSALSGDEAIRQIHELYERGQHQKKIQKKLEEGGERRRTDFPQDINEIREKKKKEKRSRTDIRPNGTIKIVIDENKKLFADSLENLDLKNKPVEKAKILNKTDCCNYFKVIFLDLEMPGKNGLETFEIILKFYKKKLMLEHLNVIAVTAYDRNNETVNKMLERGVLEVIVKPVSLEVVALSIEIEWLDSE